MPPLPLIMGPDPIFSKIAQPIVQFDHDLHTLAQDMVDTLYAEHAAGIGANMVGILKRIIVIDLQDNNEDLQDNNEDLHNNSGNCQNNGKGGPKIFINPVITHISDDTQCFEEASVCFPGIYAPITRPHTISLSYQDCTGSHHSMTADDYLATVLQHEIDYLNGIIFLDYLSPIKRKMLLKKTLKFQKNTRLIS